MLLTMYYTVTPALRRLGEITAATAWLIISIWLVDQVTDCFQLGITAYCLLLTLSWLILVVVWAECRLIEYLF